MIANTTAVATTGNDPVNLLANPDGTILRRIHIINTGTVAGYFSLDGGNTWAYLPAGHTDRPYELVIELLQGTNSTIKVKRVADGNNLEGVYGIAY
jgi:hypothetical protein